MTQFASNSPHTPPTSPDAALARMLYQHGQADAAQLRDAMVRQQATGAFLGEILVEAGVLEEQSLLSFLARNCKIPHLSLLDYLIEAKHIDLLPRELCLKHRLLPIDLLGHNLTLAMVNPLDAEALRAVQAACPELQVKPVLCAYRHFEKVAEKFFHDKSAQAAHSVSLDTLGLRGAQAVAHVPEATAAAQPSPTDTTAPQGLAQDSLLQVIFGNGDAATLDGLCPRTNDPGHTAAPPTADARLDEALEHTTIAMLDSMRATYALLARRIPLFKGLEAEAVARIFARGLSMEREANSLLFNKGDEADGLYIILDGSVTIFDGRHVLAELGRGDTVSEMASINGGLRSAGARTTTRSSLLKLSFAGMIQQLPSETTNHLMMNLVLILSERLRTANTQLLVMLRNMAGNNV